MHFDWHQFHARQHPTPAVVDPRRRMRIVLASLVLGLTIVLARVVHLDVAQGEAFREAARPIARRVNVPGVRGRILARDGAVLAADRKASAVAVHYRYLQEPVHPTWLRLTARARLKPPDRKDPRQVAQAQQDLLNERIELAGRLARLCGMSPEQWERRVRQIQARVERIAEKVNQRRLAQWERSEPNEPTLPDWSSLLSDDAPWQRIRSYVLEVLKSSMGEAAPVRITVAEERDYHVVAEDVSLAVVAEVEAHPDLYPGVKIVGQSRRVYTAASLAGHVLGYLGPREPEGVAQLDENERDRAADPEGKTGLERQYERLLRGRRGVAVEQVDHSGRILLSYREREPQIGRDLVLTLHSRLQAAAETLLDQAIQRRAVTQAGSRVEPAGGAIVALDVHTGAILAAASAPRFDPSLFARGSSPELARLLADPAHPLFDRVAGMAIPPGSVFKVLTSVALLTSGGLNPEEPMECKGYLDKPEHWRCAIYARHGTGHGSVTLADALAESCNVYFFHHARRMGPAALVDWADRFGFGHRTGVDLPGESPGLLPDAESIARLHGRDWRTADTLGLSIGQGSLTATPLQVAHLLAAVANGGRLVTPHLVANLGLPESTAHGPLAKDTSETSSDDPLRVPPPQLIPGLHDETLAAIREGLLRTVADPRGSAHATTYLESIAIAGKTGTAQTGDDRADHAWFAGYVPADRPRVAFVVVLEHAGDAASAACPLAKRLVLQLAQLGLLGPDVDAQ